MMKPFLVVACLHFFSWAMAQTKDTIRGNIDYSRQSGSFYFDEASSRNFDQYVSIQVNELLRQLVSLSDETPSVSNPFLVNYSFNKTSTGMGMGFGLGYATSHIEDVDQGNERETSNSSINFRMGFDKKSTFAKRWMVGFAIDLLFTRAKSNTRSTQGTFEFTSDNTTKGWGFGPRGLLLYKLTEKIYLGTETSWYFQKQNTESTTKFTGLPSEKSELKNSSFAIQVPVAVFLTLKF